VTGNPLSLSQCLHMTTNPYRLHQVSSGVYWLQDEKVFKRNLQRINSELKLKHIHTSSA
jgi:hypothetical protein